MTEGTTADRHGELLFNQLSSLDGVRSVGRKVGTRRASFAIDGDVDELPSHVHRLADRFDLTLVHRTTGRYGRGVESRFELVDDDRLDSIRRFEAKYERGDDETATVVEGGA